MPRGRCACSSLHDLLDLAADAAQIAAIDVGVDIEDRRDVVVIDDDRAVAALRRPPDSTAAASPFGIAPGFPYACDAPLGDEPTEAFPAADAPASDPAVVVFTAFVAAVTGVRSSSSSESMRYCDVCTPTL